MSQWLTQKEPVRYSNKLIKKTTDTNYREYLQLTKKPLAWCFSVCHVICFSTYAPAYLFRSVSLTASVLVVWRDCDTTVMSSFYLSRLSCVFRFSSAEGSTAKQIVKWPSVVQCLLTHSVDLIIISDCFSQWESSGGWRKYESNGWFFTAQCYASAVLAMALCLSVRHKSVFY